MISVKCPHCQIGLKVNEGKLPLGITSFKCPNCKEAVPISLVTSQQNKPETEEPETVLLFPQMEKPGTLTVLADEHTPQQLFALPEGVHIIGRKSSASQATLPIETLDRSMSRAHIRIEVKRDEKGGYKHLLSDYQSKNHTIYNQNYLGEDEIVVLKDQDEIIIGRTRLRFNS